MTVPDMAVSEPKFILAERYVRVDAPEDSEFAGFWCEVRQNLSIGDRRLLIEQLDAMGANAGDAIEASRVEADAIRAQLVDGMKPAEQRDVIRRMTELTAQMERLAEDATRDQWALVAPYIRDWNAYQGDPPEKIEPPQTGGPASMESVTKEMASWITVQILQAYRSGKGVTNRSTPPGDSGQPSGGPKVAKAGGTNTSSSRRRQKSSSGPSASTWNA